MTNPSYDEVFSALGPSVFADCVVVAIEERYGPDEVSREDDGIPNEYCFVHIVYQTTGFLGGDGLPGLLNLECAGAYPRRLAQLGFRELATDIERYVREHASFAGEEVDALEQSLYRQKPAINASIIAFIAAHPQIFQQLLPDIRRTLPYLEVFDHEGLKARHKEFDEKRQEMLQMIEQLRALNRGEVE
jgi:hypothetical protein